MPRTEVETLDELLDSSERADRSPRPARSQVGSQVRESTEPEEATRTRAFVGDVLAGKYRLVRPLGEGGMGSVWVAHYEALDIKVAVKIIRADAPGVSAKKLSQRMQQEARAAARTGHPAIVRITDVGETPAGDAFCVMELLDGEDIAAFLVGRGRLNAIKAVQVLLPIAHALSLVHDMGIVHRDLKPENIFLSKTADGAIQPKLIDFGIAKMELATGTDRITQGGTLLGSPAYMSPEQGRGKDVDARADIWAFSVVLYEVVSHRMPFEGDNYHALLRAIIEDAPTPLTTLGVGDRELWAIVERGLAKEPSERWQSMRDLGSALAQWLLAHGVREDLCNSSLEKTWLRRGGTATKGLAPAGDAFSRLSLPDISATIPPPSSGAAKPGEASSIATSMVSVSVAPPAPPVLRSRRASIVVIGVIASAVAAGYLLTRPPSASSVEHAAASAPAAPLTATTSAPSAAPAIPSTSEAAKETTAVATSASASASAPSAPLVFPAAPPGPSGSVAGARPAGRLPAAKPSAKPAATAAPQAPAGQDLTLRRPTF